MTDGLDGISKMLLSQTAKTMALLWSQPRRFPRALHATHVWPAAQMRRSSSKRGTDVYRYLQFTDIKILQDPMSSPECSTINITIIIISNYKTMIKYHNDETWNTQDLHFISYILDSAPWSLEADLVFDIFFPCMVCAYVCVYVYIYIHVYVYIYIYMYICILMYIIYGVICSFLYPDSNEKRSHPVFTGSRLESSSAPANLKYEKKQAANECEWIFSIIFYIFYIFLSKPCA